jgi:hypothetical protein
MGKIAIEAKRGTIFMVPPEKLTLLFSRNPTPLPEPVFPFAEFPDQFPARHGQCLVALKNESTVF